MMTGEGGILLETIKLARKIVEAASEKQAQDIVLLDIRDIAGFADFFILMSGETERHLKALYEEISHILKKEGVAPRHYEGSAGSGWLLIDYGDMIVHIFSPSQREYYRLDELWKEAKPVVSIQ